MQIKQRHLLKKIECTLNDEDLTYVIKKPLYLFEIRLNYNEIEAKPVESRNYSKKLLITGIVLGFIGIMISIDVLQNKNEILNALFYLLPAILCLFLFVISIEKIVRVPTNRGFIDFFASNKVEMALFITELQIKVKNEKVGPFIRFSKHLSYEEQIRNITILLNQKTIDKEEFEKYQIELNSVFNDSIDR